MASTNPAVIDAGEANRGGFITAPVTISASSGAATKSTQLGNGTYILTSSADVFWLQGDTNVAATTSSNPLWGKSYLGTVKVDGTGNAFISAITSSGSATVYIIQVT